MLRSLSCSLCYVHKRLSKDLKMLILLIIATAFRASVRALLVFAHEPGMPRVRRQG